MKGQSVEIRNGVLLGGAISQVVFVFN
jgi:hypothetical protein